MKKELSDYKHALDVSAIVAITDQKGTIIHANDNFCKISKYSREELIGQDHRIINSGYHSKEFIKNIWVTIANGKIWKGELKNKAKDGATYWVDTTIVPFLDKKGKPYQYIAIRSDITDRKKAEDDLIKYSKALEITNRQLVDFCNIVSHNLRAPLTNIAMLVDFIEQSKSEEERNEIQVKIKPVINHLLEVFNELVESIQVQQDTGVKIDEIIVEECVEKNLSFFETQTKKYEIEVKTELKGVSKIYFPQKYIDSVLTNLISNAIKYRSPDRKLVLEIKTKQEKDTFLLAVSDNGLGIDLDMHKHHVFKIRKTFHRHKEAKGFGLYLIKTQVEAMGGRIWVESKVDVGSTFFVEFKNIRV
ncbi:PAS domain-containing sensor histidine kinase [Flavobacterium flavipallidum]|uniref:histidine kinase n=1 Tax=Flavobacterium flavipallidum TaxID=3139140 RepID=A0ABU9HMM5_9FLAO